MSTVFHAADPAVSVRLAGDNEAVLFHPDIGLEKVVNATGLFIWQRLDGSLSVDEIARRVRERFEAVSTDRISKDVAAFVDDLSRQGFATANETRSPGSGYGTKYPGVDDAPQSVDISITGKCNYRCAYCFYANAMQAREDLSTKQWLAFFGKLGELAVRKVCLSGGEPFTRPDLWDIVDGVIANGMRYSLLTNGTLITETVLGLFEKDKRRTRLDVIQVSIDGSRAEIHDKSRGKGSFDGAVKGLRLLKAAGLPVTSRMTLNRHNLDDLDDLCRLLIEDIGLNSVGTNDAVPMGAGCSTRDTVSLTGEQRSKAMKTLEALAEKYSGRITAMAGSLANQRMYRDMERARATGEKPAEWEMGYLTACGCVFSKLAVHHDGVIVPCSMLSDLELGRIDTDSLKEIWRSHPTLEALRERRKIPMGQVPGCEDCRWTPFCNGSCPGLAYEMTGDFNRANPQDCYKRFLSGDD